MFIKDFRYRSYLHDGHRPNSPTNVLDLKSCAALNCFQEIAQIAIRKLHNGMALPADKMMSVTFACQGVSVTAVFGVNLFHRATLGEQFECAIHRDQPGAFAKLLRLLVNLGGGQRRTRLRHHAQHGKARLSEFVAACG